MSAYLWKRAFANVGWRRALRAALEYVREQGGRVVEAYPVEPRVEEMPDYLAHTGVV
jgi:hypothetical protein